MAQGNDHEEKEKYLENLRLVSQVDRGKIQQQDIVRIQRIANEFADMVRAAPNQQIFPGYWDLENPQPEEFAWLEAEMPRLYCEVAKGLCNSRKGRDMFVRLLDVYSQLKKQEISGEEAYLTVNTEAFNAYKK